MLQCVCALRAVVGLTKDDVLKTWLNNYNVQSFEETRNLIQSVGEKCQKTDGGDESHPDIQGTEFNKSLKQIAKLSGSEPYEDFYRGGELGRQLLVTGDSTLLLGQSDKEDNTGRIAKQLIQLTKSSHSQVNCKAKGGGTLRDVNQTLRDWIKDYAGGDPKLLEHDVVIVTSFNDLFKGQMQWQGITPQLVQEAKELSDLLRLLPRAVVIAAGNGRLWNAGEFDEAAREIIGILLWSGKWCTAASLCTMV